MFSEQFSLKPDMIFNNKCWTYVTQFYLSVTFGKGSSILLCKKRTMFEYIREINYEIDFKHFSIFCCFVISKAA